MTAQTIFYTYFFDEQLFTQKSLEIMTSRINMTTQPLLLGAMADKRALSFYHSADKSHRACYINHKFD